MTTTAQVMLVDMDRSSATARAWQFLLLAVFLVASLTLLGLAIHQQIRTGGPLPPSPWHD
jgi:hypothetical protein